LEDSARKITIVIVDDHPLFQQGVADALSLEDDMEVVAKAFSGEEGLELINRLQPSVAVVDVNLPGINGQHIALRLAEWRVPTRVMLLTAYDDSGQKIQALRAGAAAYCTKDIRPEDLVRCIRQVAAGGYVIDGRPLSRADILTFLGMTDELDFRMDESSGKTLALSNREMDVLACVTQGMSNKEIARRLGISQQTVKNHVTSILRKLGVEDRTQAALYALRHGWVQLNQPNKRSQE
jgi:DNA-binding NarL/FixJ family response regulator